MGASKRSVGENVVDVVCDLHGFRLSNNLDPRPTVATMEMLKHPFRNRLRTAYIVDAPVAFTGFWRVAKAAIKENTRRKIHFVSMPELLQRMQRDGTDLAAVEVVRQVMLGNRTVEGTAPTHMPSE